MSFASDFAKISAKFNDNVDTVGRKIKLDLFSAVIKDTRVDTGRLRGGWVYSDGSPSTVDPQRIDKTGEKVIGDITGRIQPFSISYLTNPVEYAIYREEKDGMITRNLGRVKRFVRDAAREVK